MMSEKFDELTLALFEALIEAPDKDLLTLKSRLDDYRQTYSRSLRNSPPNYQSLLETISEACNTAGLPRIEVELEE